MKKILFSAFLLFCVLTLLASCGFTDGETTEAPPDSNSDSALDLSSFRSKDISGRTVEGKELFSSHDLTMINIWATYCGPCLREMQDLEVLSFSYDDSFQVIGIPLDVSDANGNIKPSMKNVFESILESTEVHYPQILPSDSLNALYLNSVVYIPTTLFVDRNGYVVSEYLGCRSLSAWTEIMDELLKGQK